MAGQRGDPAALGLNGLKKRANAAATGHAAAAVR